MSTSLLALNWSSFTMPCGALRRAVELHSRLRDRFNMTAFVTDGFPAEYRDRLDGIRCISIASRRNRLEQFRQMTGASFRKHLRSGQFHLWVEEVPPLHPVTMRTVLTVHDIRHVFGLRFMGLFRLLHLSMRMRRSLESSDAVIAVSQSTADALRERYGVTHSRLHVIPNGVDPLLRERPALPTRLFPKPYILSVGHLERRKNHSALISSFAGISRAWKGSLVIAGRDGPWGRRLRREVSDAGLSGRVFFTGGVNEIELRTLLRDCSILADSSLLEGFGMTILEGMAMGRPVILSDIPAHREVAGTAACFVKQGEGMTAEFSKELLRLLEDRSMQDDLVDLGMRRVRDYDWDRSAERLAELYVSLVRTDTGGSRSPRGMNR